LARDMGRGKAAPEIVSAEVSVFSHATEDEGKVEEAVLNVIQGEDRGRPKVQRLTGYHNDPITMMTWRVRKRKAAAEIFLGLMRSLAARDRWRLIEEAEDRVDEAGNLYLRLDKQRAYRGRAVLHEADPIRVKFRFRIPHGAEPVGAVRDALASVVDEIEREADRGS